MALATLLHIYRGPYIYIVFITEILSDQVRDNPMSEKFIVIDIVFGELGNNKSSIFRSRDYFLNPRQFTRDPRQFTSDP